jgi:spore germination protein KC
MIRFRPIFLLSASLLFMVSASGCTDFVEPNQLAFVIGTAIDQAPDGTIEVGHQIVIPAQLKTAAPGNSEHAIVMSAKGRTVFEASQKIQKKISRRILTSHRTLIAIGEAFFERNDVGKLYDKLGRDPANNLRDIVVLIRGGSARDFLKLKHPMEYLSSIAAEKELHINGLRRFSTRQLVMDSLSDGTRPMVPFLQIEKIGLTGTKKTSVAVVSGFAVLDKKLKVKEFLNETESTGAVWMAGKGAFDGITMPWKDGEGMLSFRFTHLDRRIRADHVQGSPRIALTVSAQAYLLENTTPLDMSEIDAMADVQKQLNAHVQKELQLTMDKVRRSGSDVFGFGEYLHRHSPYWWKTQKGDWDEKFKNIEVAVKSDIQVRSVGAISSELK